MKGYSLFVALLTIQVLIFPPRIQAQQLPDTYPSHYFSFHPADSISYPDIYPDQEIRDSIAASYKNTYKAAKAIEKYALEKQDITFLKRLKSKNRTWQLILSSGKQIEISPPPGSSAVDYTFEYYYPSLQLIVFRAQWYEGNNYVLVSRKDGSKTTAYGPPILSPDKNFFLTYNGQEVSDYSNNGLQLFKVKEEEIKKLIEYNMELVPSRCKWMDEDTFHLQVYDFQIRPGKGIKRNYQHSEVDINETGH